MRRVNLVVAVLAAALFVLSAFAAMQLHATDPAARAPVGNAIPPLQGGVATSYVVNGVEQDVHQGILTQAQADIGLQWYEHATAAQIALGLKVYQQWTKTGVQPSAQDLQAIKYPATELNGFCVVSAVASGALLGGLMGAYAQYLGAQQNCVIQSINNQRNSNAYAGAIIGAYSNEVNITNADYQTIVSILNSTGLGLERMADNAALLQIGNGSYNVSEDLFQSNIDASVAPILFGYETELSAEFTSTVTVFNGHYATNDIYAGGSPTFIAEPPINAEAVQIGLGPLFTTSTANVYIQHAAAVASSGFPQAYKNELTGLVVNSPTCNTQGSGFCSWNFTGPSGVYDLFMPGGSPVFYDTMGQPNAGAASANIYGSAASVTGIDTDGANGAYNLQSIGTGSGVFITQGASTITYTDHPEKKALWVNLGAYLGLLEYNAAVSGQAYWQFLRAAGFTNIHQIPPDCIIPAPYMVLPSALNLSDLTGTEVFSLYLSTLQDFAHFYNTTLNQSNFCNAGNPKHVFQFGGQPWGNLFINATGYIYLDNGTAAIDVNGKVNGHEAFAQPKTWSIGNTTYGGVNYLGPQQFVLMPTLYSVNIPVGQAWAVPSVNPVEVYVVQSGIALWLTGNGTNPSGAPIACPTSDGFFCPLVQHAATGNVTPGDSMFLTSCVVSGQATNNCTVTVQTVNVTIPIISCPGNCTDRNATGPTGVWWNFPNPFAALADWLDSLFPGLGGWAGLLADIIVIVIIAAVIYIAYSLLVGWGRERRSPPRQTEMQG